jgi:hypothetical protein
MKLNFDTKAMQWMHEKVNQMIVVAREYGDDSTGRTARKMRHKFHGNPPVVFLTAKERALLNDIISYRLESLQTQATEERETLTKIVEALHVT